MESESTRYLYALPPLQASIHNLRTILGLLSDKEFESEFELERQRRNSLKQKKPPAAAADGNNSDNHKRKRAPPPNAEAESTTDNRSSPKRQKKNDDAVSRDVVLPSVLAHDNSAHADDGDEHDDGGGAAQSPSTKNHHGIVANNNNVLTLQNAASWDLQGDLVVETQNDEEGKEEGLGAVKVSTKNHRQERRGVTCNHVALTELTAQNAATTWDLRFLELVEFKKQKGHCNVSDSTHKGTEWHQLATWCCNQRKNFINRQSKAKLGQKVRRKGGVMTDEQMERLANIGFRFGPTHVEFETRFLQLAEYKAIHSHTRVPISYTGHDNLGRYVKKTKEQYRAGKLDPARIARLQTIGFNFSRRGDVTPMNNDSTSAAAAAAPTKNKKPAKRSSKKKQKTAGPPPPPPPPSTLPQLVAAAAAAAASEGLPAQATASPSPAEGSPAQETAATTGAQGPTVPAPPAPQNETGLPPETGKASCSTPAAAYAEV